MSFETKVIDSLVKNLNNYYTDNHDYIRYGERKLPIITSIKKGMFSRLSKLKYFKSPLPQYNEKSLEIHLEKFKDLYGILKDEQSKQVLIDVLLYRVLGEERILLPLNRDNNYFNKVSKAGELADRTKQISIPYAGFNLYFHDLSKIDKNIKLFFTTKGIFTDFIAKQYEYHNNNVIIKAGKADVVLDCGGCWGDTALYFADEVGEKGKVYSFEFIPTNLDVFKKNLELNPNLSTLVKVIENPVWDKSDVKLYYLDEGPGSNVSFNKEPGMDKTVMTISIDDLIERDSIHKVDYIKMDIEGAELNALKGAEKTIRKFRPKLGIALYHSLSDFETIPKWLHDLNLEYDFFLGHFSIHSEETILFAKPSK